MPAVTSGGRGSLHLSVPSENSIREWSQETGWRCICRSGRVWNTQKLNVSGRFVHVKGREPGIAKIDNRVKYIAHMLASDSSVICMGKFELGGEGDTLSETAA